MKAVGTNGVFPVIAASTRKRRQNLISPNDYGDLEKNKYENWLIQNEGA